MCPTNHQMFSNCCFVWDFSDFSIHKIKPWQKMRKHHQMHFSCHIFFFFFYDAKRLQNFETWETGLVWGLRATALPLCGASESHLCSRNVSREWERRTRGEKNGGRQCAVIGQSQRWPDWKHVLMSLILEIWQTAADTRTQKKKLKTSTFEHVHAMDAHIWQVTYHMLAETHLEMMEVVSS